MQLGLMPGTPPEEMRALGFVALQQFFASNKQDDADDPGNDQIREALGTPPLALSAMTVHSDLVNGAGVVPADVARVVRLVRRTAALRGAFGDNPKPILVWHPSGYPADAEAADHAIFAGLVTALKEICQAAVESDIYVAVEMTRAGSVGSAEGYLRLRDQVASPALKVCLDAANIAPDRTPLVRCVRMLAEDIVLAHGKDSHFNSDGTVAGYGPAGSGKLDYATYIAALKEHCSHVPYFILEYYKSRDDMLRARDLVLQYL